MQARTFPLGSRDGVASSAVRNVKAVNKIHHSKTQVKDSDDRTPKQEERRHVTDLTCAG